MPALPRIECPWCGRSVPTRRNGALREHNAFDSPGAPAYAKCEGSGQIPDPWHGPYHLEEKR